MKLIMQKLLTLSLLIFLPGCFDFGCCKKNTETHAAQPATPKEYCSHAGCTHGHNKDLVDQQAGKPCTHTGCHEMHTHNNSHVAHAPCENSKCTHGHKYNTTKNAPEQKENKDIEEK